MTDAFVVFRQALEANLNDILGPLVPPQPDLDRRLRDTRPLEADGAPANADRQVPDTADPGADAPGEAAAPKA